MEYTFAHDHDQALQLTSERNPLPRSIALRNVFELLDGTWRFALDPQDVGLHEGWYRGHEYTQTAAWPGSIESHLAEADHGSTWQDMVVCWYEREFSVPDEWRDLPGMNLHITFGACGYETRVWLNGQALRTLDGEEVHYGGYTSFSYEVPFAALQPVNRLTVRVAASYDDEIPRGKQESHVYKRGGIWYQTISGAVRSVWIEPVRRNRFRTRLRLRQCLAQRLVEFGVTTHIVDPGTYTAQVTIALRGSQAPPLTRSFPLPLDAGEHLQWLPLVLPEVARWSPATPELYQLILRLIGPDGLAAQIETHFGMREVTTLGPAVVLNDASVYLDGILYQPGTATYDEMRRHMLAMRELGCNLVRVHIAGIDPRIYDLADELGMLLWVEVPSPHTSSQRSRANHWAELQRLLLVIGSHPSVIILSLYNEDWGVQDIAHSEATRAYIARVVDDMHLHYPGLLVVDNDGWQHISVNGELKSDLLSAHVYTPDLATWDKTLDEFVAGQLEGVAVNPLVVGDPFFYAGQAALVVSEWGGFGFPAYGGPEEVRAKTASIRAFKRALRQHAIGGDVYTQATSIEDEVNGLIDPTTGALLVPPGILSSQPE